MNHLNKKIEFKDVFLADNGFDILNNLSFSIDDKKIIGLLGRNGAGKTSLLSLLASYLLPAKGKILIDGEEAFENDEKMEEVAFIYPSDYSDTEENIENFIELISSYRPHFDEEYAKHLIRQFNLPLNKPIYQLSKGMQSAMNVTLGLASRSPITIFDEAYLSMDAPSREIFYEEILEDQTSHPRLFIISTHLVSEAEYLFDDVLIINEGELLHHKDYETLVSQGAAVTGSAEEVDVIVNSYKVFDEKHLGRVKSVTIFGENIDNLQEEAKAKNLDIEISPVSLQLLFNHLIKERNPNEQ